MTTIQNLLSSTSSYYSTSYSTDSATVSKTDNTSISNIAAKLSTESGIIATLSGSATPYDAVNLLNSIVEAGTSSASSASGLYSDSGSTAAESLIGTLVSSIA